MFDVGGRMLGQEAPVFVIAEIGANFSGIDEGKALIAAAADAGADAVKFQTYTAETVALPGATFTLEDGSVISQYDFFKASELSRPAHLELQRSAAEHDLVFFSTPGYYDDLELLEDLGVGLYKTGSDDLTNYPFLKAVAACGKPMIVSTGMCTLGEIEKAVEAVVSTGNEQLVLMHCVVGYPAPIEEANLRVIDTLRQAFGKPVGLSDHCRGPVAGILGVGLGAVCLEKHLCRDRSAGGPDNDVACQPDELAEYIGQIRQAEAALGCGRKQIGPGEEKWRRAARKSLVAAGDIAAGQILTPELVTIKRPSSGLHPQYFEMVLGRRARRPIAVNALIALEDLD